ncbi:MAG TPA: hypothetical protein VF338_07360, partial [Leptolinea sp.]
MISADVMSLARAAPEPATTPRVSSREDGNSFDQFLQAVSTDHSVSKDESTQTHSSERETDNEVAQSERKDKVEQKQTEGKKVDEKKVDEKSVKEEDTQDKIADESVEKAIAAAVAAQVMAAVTPVQKPEEIAVKQANPEVIVPAVVLPVQPNSQATVIQLPETEPQPLPDELKQAVQQPKVEVKDFQTLIDAASKNLENQAMTTTGETEITPAVSTPGVQAKLPKDLDVLEPAVKVVDLKAQSEDLTALESSRTASG